MDAEAALSLCSSDFLPRYTPHGLTIQDAPSRCTSMALITKLGLTRQL